jgi:lysophospholipase L1-like esterase
MRAVLLAGGVLMAITVWALEFPAFKQGAQLYGPWGGALKPVGEALELTTTRVQLPDGSESWEGCAMAGAAEEVIPGLRYTWTVTLDGQGTATVGVMEYPWKHSAVVLAQPGERRELGDQPATIAFSYTPTRDDVMFVRPYVRMTGWRGRVRITAATFGEMVLQRAALPPPELGHVLVAPGQTLAVKLPTAPAKLLLYGPSGVSGLNLPMGGSPAFVDHFIAAHEAAETTFALPIPATAPSGSYRLVVVQPGAPPGVSMARFTVRPPAELAAELALLERVKLPDGTRLVCVGDSLSANFPGRNYPALLERGLAWRSGSKVQVINAGVGGDNIQRIAKRLEQDVIAAQPTHVLLFEGGNDCKVPFRPATGDTGEWAVPPATYEATLREVLTALKTKTQARIIVATCAPGHPEYLAKWEAEARRFGEGRNFFCRPDEVAKIVAIQQRVATELGCEVLDTNRLLAGRLDLFVDDGVHLNELGAQAVFRIVLEYLAKGKE